MVMVLETRHRQSLSIPRTRRGLFCEKADMRGPQHTMPQPSRLKGLLNMEAQNQLQLHQWLVLEANPCPAQLVLHLRRQTKACRLVRNINSHLTKQIRNQVYQFPHTNLQSKLLQ